jgi:hypothetical protein
VRTAIRLAKEGSADLVKLDGVEAEHDLAGSEELDLKSVIGDRGDALGEHFTTATKPRPGVHLQSPH